MLTPANPVSVTGTQVVSATPATYRGFHLFSTAGATVVIYDNASAASGTILAKFTLAAGADREVEVSTAVRCAAGIYLTATAAIEGHVRVG